MASTASATGVSGLSAALGRRSGRRGQQRGIAFWISVGWLALLTLCAVLADWIPGLPPYREPVGRIAAPPSLHIATLLGTDGVGRSTLSMIVYGARISLIIAVCSTVIGLIIGVFIGALAGYYRGAADACGTIIANCVSAVPPLLLLLALVAAMGATLEGITIALGCVISELYIRIVKGAVIATASRDYVLAARAMGASDARIICREILPSLVPVLAAVVPMGMALMIVVEGSLSFLGYGIPPPNPSWGGLIAAGADLVRKYPYVLAGPVVSLVLTVFAFNTLGEHLGNRGDRREAQL